MSSTFPMIDAHAHLCINRDFRTLDKIAESGLLHQVWLLALECYPPEFEFDGNAAVREISRCYPGFFLPFGWLDFFQGPEQIDRLKEQGFVGLKALRPPADYDDLRYFPLYERAEQLGMPILFHVGIISHRTREELTIPVLPGPSHMRPAMLDAIAASFPQLIVIQGHQGMPWCNELFESLYQYDNMRCCVTGYVDYKWLIDNLARTDYHGRPFYQKMMIGTDSFYGLPEHFERVKRYRNFMHDFFNYVGNSYSWRRGEADYMYGNAAAIFPCQP